MNCQELTEILDALIDKELDPVQTLKAEQHLKQCPECARRFEEQKTLHNLLSNQSLYFEAPQSLSGQVRKAVRSTAKPQTKPPSRRWDLSWLWPRRLAPIAIAFLAMLLVVPALLTRSSENRLTGEIVSAHVRSLMADHLTDVVSSDQHTVKPWFNGKVTFSPPVPDLAAHDFPLIGGRLDVLDEQPVAAMIYQHRKHYINLFIWPGGHSDTEPKKVLTQRGYNLIHWTQGGMNCWAVSDVNGTDLQQFAQLIRTTIEHGQGMPQK